MLWLLKSLIFAIFAYRQINVFAHIFAPVAGEQMPRSHRLPMCCKDVAFLWIWTWCQLVADLLRMWYLQNIRIYCQNWAFLAFALMPSCCKYHICCKIYAYTIKNERFSFLPYNANFLPNSLLIIIYQFCRFFKNF